MGNPIPSSLVNSEPYAYPKINVEWAGVLIGLLYPLLEASYWEGEPQEVIDVCNEVDELIAQLMRDAVLSMPIGTIFPYYGTLPANALECDFSLKNKADYPLLYDVLDAALIVDADHFKTPPAPLWVTALTKVYSASSTYLTNVPANLDDGSTSTLWISNGGVPPSEWVEINFNYPVPITAYTIHTGAANTSQLPKTWKLQGYNGGWVDLDTRTNQTLAANTQYTYNVAANYARWRLYVDAVSGGSGFRLSMATFQLSYTAKNYKYGIVASEA